MRRSWTRAGNHIGVWMYRTLNGRLSSGSRNVHVLMTTSPEVSRYAQKAGRAIPVAVLEPA